MEQGIDASIARNLQFGFNGRLAHNAMEEKSDGAAEVSDAEVRGEEFLVQIAAVADANAMAAVIDALLDAVEYVVENPLSVGY